MDYVTENGFVKIPKREFEGLLAELNALKESMEERLDIAALDQALRLDEELLPAELVRRMVSGESPIRVFREYRGLTQQALADTVGVSKTTICELERGRKEGSIKTLSAIADALNVDIDDLI
ncbi:helix-turn-helix transcriptional regulator [Parasphingorhabdus sp. DH2-15]|uniref:helix-turn-helix transcriptional regulator n=1 Tax=Parasphingorhabdus sp. DH2-15 TaxID=3444112 RepID=UPI003F6890E7